MLNTGCIQLSIQHSAFSIPLLRSYLLPSGLAGRLWQQRPLEVSHCLAEALLVFDQRDAHVSFAMFAKGAAGGEGHFRLVHHAEAEIDRPFALLEMGGIDLCPDEHACLRLVVAPAKLVQASADFIAPLFIELAL